jgi:hypothetical protein
MILVFVSNGVTAEICDAEQDPKDDRRKKHGEDGSRPNLLDHPVIGMESTADKSAEKILHKEIKKNGHSGECGGEIPFAFPEYRPDSLHEKSHEGIEYDGVAKLE